MASVFYKQNISLPSLINQCLKFPVMIRLGLGIGSPVIKGNINVSSMLQIPCKILSILYILPRLVLRAKNTRLTIENRIEGGHSQVFVAIRIYLYYPLPGVK